MSRVNGAAFRFSYLVLGLRRLGGGAFLAAVAAIAVAIVLLLGHLDALVDARRLAEMRRDATGEVVRLREEIAELQDDIEAMQNDPFYVESVARQEHGYGRPGEVRLPPDLVREHSAHGREETP